MALFYYTQAFISHEKFFKQWTMNIVCNNHKYKRQFLAASVLDLSILSWYRVITGPNEPLYAALLYKESEKCARGRVTWKKKRKSYIVKLRSKSNNVWKSRKKRFFCTTFVKRSKKFRHLKNIQNNVFGGKILIRLFSLIFKPCVRSLYELCERLFTMRANKVPFDLIAVLKGQIARLRGWGCKQNFLGLHCGSRW